MKSSDEEFNIHDELKWISMKEIDYSGKLKSKGIFGIIVPIGCIATSGILMLGVYNMFKRNLKQQQLFMRYRVLAQGITIALATAGILQFKST